MTDDCDHPSSDVTIHHRDAVRAGSMETLNIPAYCNGCDTELTLTYILDARTIHDS